MSQSALSALPQVNVYTNVQLNGHIPKVNKVRWSCIAAITRYMGARCLDMEVFFEEMVKHNDRKIRESAAAIKRKWDWVLSQFEARILSWILNPVFDFLLWTQERGPKAHLAYDYVQSLISSFDGDLTLADVPDALNAQLNAQCADSRELYLEFINNVRRAVSVGIKKRFDMNKGWAQFYAQFRFFGVLNHRIEVSAFPSSLNLSVLPWYDEWLREQGGSRVAVDREWNEVLSLIRDERRGKSTEELRKLKSHRFWRRHALRFPVLSGFAESGFQVPVASSDVEGCLKNMKVIDSAFNVNMVDDTIGDRLFCMVNAPVLSKLFDPRFRGLDIDTIQYNHIEYDKVSSRVRKSKSKSMSMASSCSSSSTDSHSTSTLSMTRTLTEIIESEDEREDEEQALLKDTVEDVSKEEKDKDKKEDEEKEHIERKTSKKRRRLPSVLLTCEDGKLAGVEIENVGQKKNIVIGKRRLSLMRIDTDVTEDDDRNSSA